MLTDRDQASHCTFSLHRAMERFSIDSCVRGYLVYNDIWEASVGEELPCHSEGGNPTDPYAVVIKRSGVIVRYIPRTLATLYDSQLWLAKLAVRLGMPT